jgi:peptide deformylase
MALRNLVFYGNPILRQKAKKIHRFDASLLLQRFRANLMVKPLYF